MFEKLKAVEDKFNEINEKLMQPEVVNDNAQYTALMKEYKQLEPIIAKLGEYKTAKASFDEASELLDQGGLDKDFKELVQMQYEEAKQQLEEAKALAEKIGKAGVKLSIKAGEGGKTFGSISSKEIAEAAASQCGFELDKKKIVLKDPIKAEGVYKISVKLHPQVTGELTVEVTIA